MHTPYSTRTTATAALRRMGLTPADYDRFLKPMDDKMGVDLEAAQSFAATKTGTPESTKAPTKPTPVVRAISELAAYSLSGFKSFTGMEGYGFNINLLLNGKKVAFVMDDASGGMIRWEWTSDAEEKAFAALLQADYDANGGHEKHVAHCIEVGIPAEHANEPQKIDSIMDSWIGKAIDDLANTRRFDRLAKTNTLFRNPDMKPGEWRSVKAVGPRAVEAAIKYSAGKPCLIYSGNPSAV